MHCVLGQDTYCDSHSASLHLSVQMGTSTSEFNAGGSPAALQRTSIPSRGSRKLQVTSETGISFDLMGHLARIRTLRSAHTMGLVPVTSPCNKSQGLVTSCELAIFAAKSSRWDQNLVPATSPTNSNWFEFVGLVAGTKFGLCD